MEINITDANSSEIIASSKVVLVDFSAPWCGPCRALAPVIDEISAEYEGKAVIAKCNVDDCEDFAAAMRVRNIPCLVYFKDGEVADRSVGLVSKKDISDKLNALLA